MSFYAIVGYLTAPLLGIIGMNRSLQDALIAADRLYDIMDLELDGSGGTAELAPGPLDAIRFSDVHFGYGARPPLFVALNLTIPAASITAIIGESGSGKSTLAALLQMIYTPTSGRISIGDMELRNVSRKSLRRSIGVVPQQIHLLAGSLLDNIILGASPPDLRRVLEVCRLVGLDSLVDDLPAGLATEIGENGVSLSGGQRQRVAIARALYRDPPIIVLDEATSSLDATSESDIRRAVRHLRDAGKTVLVIAHRLTSVADADRILVLSRGALAEEGTHSQLLSAQGVYADLWNQQFGPSPPTSEKYAHPPSEHEAVDVSTRETLLN
jgi:ATP-binding cassette, subfamily C, bacteriocin exporter